MKVAILGGTGSLGRGLAIRLSEKNDVFLGSRDASRGESIAARISSATGRKVRGGAAADAAVFCDAAIFAVTFVQKEDYFAGLRRPLSGKLAVSAMVPMALEDGRFVYKKKRGSAAEYLSTILKSSRVAAALHTVPAPMLQSGPSHLDLDVPVAADDKEVYTETAKLIGSVQGLRPLYAGGLTTARSLEELTPLILNVARLNGLRNPSIKFV